MLIQFYIKKATNFACFHETVTKGVAFKKGETNPPQAPALSSEYLNTVVVIVLFGTLMLCPFYVLRPNNELIHLRHLHALK